RKNLEFENYLSNLKLLSRNNILKEIAFDIIKNNDIFRELQINNKGTYKGKKVKEHTSISNYIEEIISKIQDNPTKKVFYLKEFLNNFDDSQISKNDKNVLLQSLKAKDIEELNREMLNLLKTFKAMDFE
ncbi:MAG: hypothetical protein ACFFAN_06325, partial [Promethearchaeota archaeon]